MLRNMTSIYIINNDKILLLYRIGSRVVSPSWCGIGGHFEKEELNNPKACVLRELLEETGITVNDVEHVKLNYITLLNKINEIRQNYYYFTTLINKNIKIDSCNEGTLEWVSTDQILEKEMPFTAKQCLKHYLSTGKNNDKIYAGIITNKHAILNELNEF